MITQCVLAPVRSLLASLRPELTSHPHDSEAPLPRHCTCYSQLPLALPSFMLASPARGARSLASPRLDSPSNQALFVHGAHPRTHAHAHIHPSPTHDEIASYTLTRVKRLAVSIPYVGRDSQRLILQANTETTPPFHACVCACACVSAPL